MITKIISGGQTGADQAALDAAIKWQIPHGGWIPKGRITEAGRLPDKYQLQEMPNKSYAARTEKNVIDSDGTLIISHGPLSGGSKYTRLMAIKHNRPRLHIDLNKKHDFDAAKQVYQWITKYHIEILNIAGPRASKDPIIYQTTMSLIIAVLHFDLIKSVMPTKHETRPFMPQTVHDAVEFLISKMPLKDRIKIANMPETDLIYLHLSLGSYIRETFGIYLGNEVLMRNCRKILGKINISEDEVSHVIIKELWKRLHKTHALRVIK